jgi:hypothetical protein
MQQLLGLSSQSWRDCLKSIFFSHDSMSLAAVAIDEVNCNIESRNPKLEIKKTDDRDALVQAPLARIFHMMIAPYIGFTRNFLKKWRIRDYGRLKKIFLWNQ